MIERVLRNWLRIVVLVASFAGALSGLVTQAVAQTAGGLSASLSVPATSFDAAVGVHVDFTLTNRSAGAVSVLIWNTPFESIRNNIFQVTKDGRPVRYTGPMVKRGKPRPSDYLTLAAGEAKTVRVDLAAVYAIAEVGTYQVRFDSTLIDVAAVTPGLDEAAGRLDAGASVPLVSADVTLRVSAGRAIRFAPVDEPSLSGPATTSFKSCSVTRQNALRAALTGARTMARNAHLALANTAVARRPAARRSKLWFGAYASARYALVQAHFSKISTALANRSYAFDCTCTEPDTFAYVYPDEPYKVYLCGAFWSAPTIGTDSKAGTLVHESSHFTVLGGTQDHAYGQTGAKALARNNPGRAVRNADNHEYFAENTPSTAQP